MLVDGVYSLAYFHKGCNKKDCNDEKRSVIMEKDLSQWKNICDNRKDLW